MAGRPAVGISAGTYRRPAWRLATWKHGAHLYSSASSGWRALHWRAELRRALLPPQLKCAKLDSILSPMIIMVQRRATLSVIYAPLRVSRVFARAQLPSSTRRTMGPRQRSVCRAGGQDIALIVLVNQAARWAPCRLRAANARLDKLIERPIPTCSRANL